MKEFVKKLESKESLSFEESKSLFSNIMEGKYDEDSIIKILNALSDKGETKDELAGGIYVLRNKASTVKSEQDTIDTCGTGGDGQNSLNISTALSIISKFDIPVLIKVCFFLLATSFKKISSTIIADATL